MLSLRPLHTSFTSPYGQRMSYAAHDFRLPGCYKMQAPQLKLQLFQKFALETLFYIFYSMPRDILQVAAAQELCAHLTSLYYALMVHPFCCAEGLERILTWSGFSGGLLSADKAESGGSIRS